MQSIQENIIVDLLLKETKKIHFIAGMGGFEQIKDFILTMNPSEAPLLWLLAQNYPNISFLTVDPFLVCPGYQPEFDEEDLEILGIHNAENMLVLSIAHPVKNDSHGITLNLKAPIVINWETGEAQQLIITNEKGYSLEYPVLPDDQLEAA
jgi:flagellar assembly factor FliW